MSLFLHPKEFRQQLWNVFDPGTCEQLPPMQALMEIDTRGVNLFFKLRFSQQSSTRTLLN